MLSVVIITFRRPEALRRTLHALEAMPAVGEIVVADNASCDETLGMLTREFPRVRVVALDANLGVEGFNRAAAIARGDVLLILDDDAIPDEASLGAAVDVLAKEPGVAAVALHPVQAVSGASEWPFAKAARDHWPVMGCGNLVRAEAWRQVGGYEAAFFLYRNDVDLALKLLAAGHDVRFDPAWVVRHDSPATGPKSERWLKLATRNWIWLAKRHGRGVWRWLGGFAGVAWAVRLAGWRPARWGAVLTGAWAGLCATAPANSGGPRVGGAWWREFLRLRQ